jgi:hypothetical protein
MTWIKRAELLMTWKTLTWLMTWQVTRLMLCRIVVVAVGWQMTWRVNLVQL